MNRQSNVKSKKKNVIDLALTSTKSKRLWVLVVEALGFVSIIVLTWLDEAVMLPHHLLGQFVHIGRWREPILESLVVLIIAVPTLTLTWRLLSRLQHLERFIRMCAWCRKLDKDGEWVTVEQYFSTNDEITFSHGICDSCANSYREEYGLKPKAPTFKAQLSTKNTEPL